VINRICPGGFVQSAQVVVNLRTVATVGSARGRSSPRSPRPRRTEQHQDDDRVPELLTSLPVLTLLFPVPSLTRSSKHLGRGRHGRR
jgi:hypothetical protein